MYFIIFEERNEDEEERTENRLIDKICVSHSCNFNQGETIAYQYSNQYLGIEFNGSIIVFGHIKFSFDFNSKFIE